MRQQKTLLTSLLLALTIGTTTMASTSNTKTLTPKEVVAGFVADIRSGKHLEKVTDYMAPKVIAHQVHAEGGHAVERAPEDYVAHIEEFIEAFAPFTVTVEELLADGDRVFVRWRQDGFHNVSLEGETPTGKKLTEITSTVYRIENGKIVEYWLQTDRAGMSNQIKE
ncbi:MAG: ester cyclase [Kordiimonas sp.]